MESFFLSETAKYLYLLHSNATTLPDFYIFSTEGHLLPVLPYEEPSLQSPGPATMVQKPKHGICRDLCRARSQEELLKVRKSLSSCRPSPVYGSNHYVPAALQRHKILRLPFPSPQGPHPACPALEGAETAVIRLRALDRGLSMKFIATRVNHGEELLQLRDPNFFGAAVNGTVCPLLCRSDFVLK